MYHNTQTCTQTTDASSCQLWSHTPQQPSLYTSKQFVCWLEFLTSSSSFDYFIFSIHCVFRLLFTAFYPENNTRSLAVWMILSLLMRRLWCKKLNEKIDYPQQIRLIVEVSSHSITYIWLLLLLFSCMMTVSQDIFNICITCVVYEVRRKGIIYSKTCFFSLFTPCLGIKSQSNKK